ncbi:MAG: prepilin-type N-terminal cleavage/methylation domain-containing protein [Lachnospiraceae bacterium]|nr:prepilin-type N-terminal cleavage/methylation domain-containing protein [Lachnospiraceae bacterium]
MGKRMNNKGVTLTEMVVSFALLGIFLIAVSIIITYAVKNYYHEKRVMTSYSVADLVLDEIKDDIQTMQASPSEINGINYGAGYVKLRTESGTTIPVIDDRTIKGDTIEFVSSNIKDAVYAEQIDTKGYTGYMIRNQAVTQSDSSIDPLEADKLTVRYYSKDLKEETISKYYDLYVDSACADAEITKNVTGLKGGANVVRDCEEKISKDMYDSFTIDLEFSISPVKVGSQYVVKSVVASVSVIEDGDVKYTKEREIPVQNLVYYNSKPTMYSEVS